MREQSFSTSISDHFAHLSTSLRIPWEYASTTYTERLLSVGAHISMSAKGNASDNAKAESFFKTLKQEEVYLKQYQTFEEASANIGQFIDDVYNTKRLHSGLGDVPPAEFEPAYYQGIPY
jgi:putative transposase